MVMVDVDDSVPQLGWVSKSYGWLTLSRCPTNNKTGQFRPL